MGPSTLQVSSFLPSEGPGYKSELAAKSMIWGMGYHVEIEGASAGRTKDKSTTGWYTLQ